MADNQYDYPTETPIVGDDFKITVPWGQWFSRTHRAVLSIQQSGPTIERPSSVLWIGRVYFDTTLGKPVWIKQVKPVVVWVTADGVVA